jgi:hypothetical protein
MITQAQKINFVIDDEKQEADRLIAVDIEKWLAEQHCSYKFYFTEDNN